MSFAFVNQSSLSSSPDRQVQLPHNRELILRASRLAAAQTRRRNGTGTKVNLRQIPDFLLRDGKLGEDINLVGACHSRLQENKISSSDRLDLLGHSEYSPVVPTSLTLGPALPPALDKARLLELGESRLLDNLIRHIDPATPHVDIVRLHRLSRLAQCRILLALADKDHETSCSRLAMDCVSAQLERMVHADGSQPIDQVELQTIYQDALRETRLALMEKSEADWVLFKTMLLFDLFELLDLKNGAVNDYHAQAASRALASFEPGSVNTGFRRDLLAAEAELQILSSIITNNECFLQKPGWQSALKLSIIYDEELGPRSPLVLELTMISANVPGLFKRVTNLVTQECIDGHVCLAQEICDLIHRYENWSHSWDALVRDKQRLRLDFQPNDQTFEVAIGARYLGYFAMCNRLLAAIDPLRSVKIERRAIYASQTIVQSTNSCSSSGPCAPGIHLARQVARSVMSTTSSWADRSSYGLYTIRSDVFDSLCGLLNRSKRS